MDAINQSDIRLLSEKRVPLKSLTGFKKHHRLPDKGSTVSDPFLADLAKLDLDADLDKTFSALRKKFGLKRKEMETSGPGDGVGAITTPGFTYEVSVQTMEDEPQSVLWRRAISAIKEADAVTSEPFDVVFGADFDMLEILLNEAIDVESVIDRVEDADSDNIKIDYEKDVTWCKIRFSDQKTIVEVNENSIRVRSEVETTPHELIESFFAAHQEFLMDDET